MEDYFAGIDPIRFAGPDSRDPLSYRYYEPERVVAGKTMAEHFRFSVAYWHTFRGTGMDPFGLPTLVRPWDDGSDSLDNALRRMRVAFAFIQKLGLGYYCFHDRDIAPEGPSLAETNRNLDRVVDLAEKLQADTGIRLLWGTANLFSNPRYMNGAATNPDAHVFAYAAAQVKKALEVTHRLGGANYVFWGGREGYATLLNTDMKREQDHLARFLQMAADYRRETRIHRYPADRAQAEGAYHPPVRLRRGGRAQLPARLRTRPVQAQHRVQPRHAGRPYLCPRAADRFRRRPARDRSTPTPAIP